MRRPLPILLALLLLVIPACGRAGPPPSGSPDADRPRYVVLSPALAVMLRDLGHEQHIVARHAYDLVLDESLPVAGELGRIDYEVLLSAAPTHVLIEWGDTSQPLPDRLTRLSRERDFQVLRFSMLTLDDIEAAVERLEQELPPADRGPDEGYWQDRMRRAWQGPAGVHEHWPRHDAAGRILLIASTDPMIGVTGPGSWHHQILEAVGGVPAITQGDPWMELSPEDVLRLDPQGIILIQPRGRDEPADGIAPAASPAAALARLGPLSRLDLSAIRLGRVALIDDPLAHTPSTAMVGLTERLDDILRAWAAQEQSQSVIPALGETGN